MTNKGKTHHYMTGTPTYGSWWSMVERCTSASHSSWDRYGGRGIFVCERWRDFRNFLADMGERPTGLTLDRINPEGNYEPGNCRWADWETQNRNQCRTKKYEFKGRLLSIPELADEVGINRETLRCRLGRYGFTVEEAVAFGIRRGGRTGRRGEPA